VMHRLSSINDRENGEAMMMQDHTRFLHRGLFIRPAVIKITR
jgi:hypothetical protein